MTDEIGTVVGAVLVAAALVPALHPLVGDLSFRSRRERRRSRAHPMLLPPDPTAASTDALCRAWRISYLVLENTRDPAQRAQVAAMRGRYLDEIARRDPAGFQRWLSAGARAGGDPIPYLATSEDLPEPPDDAPTRPSGRRD